MKYIQYLLIALLVDASIFLVIAPLSSARYALQTAIVVFPLCLWTARLIVARRRGEITRRMPMLDGGAVFDGVFWSFSPEIYRRRPGFDNFKGYFIKESLCCFLIWVMFMSPTLLEVLDGLGFDVR